jgi:hypothetical protein
MSVNQVLFRLGLGIYALSFFLLATGDPKGGLVGRLRGFECAYFAVQVPLTSTPFSPDRADYIPPFMYLSTVISGLINPVFVVHAAFASLRRNPRMVGVLKFTLLSMIPFCWVVLYDLGVYPREGHVFWVIGMLLVLFSSPKQARLRLTR